MGKILPCWLLLRGCHSSYLDVDGRVLMRTWILTWWELCTGMLLVEHWCSVEFDCLEALEGMLMQGHWHGPWFLLGGNCLQGCWRLGIDVSLHFDRMGILTGMFIVEHLCVLRFDWLGIAYRGVDDADQGFDLYVWFCVFSVQWPRAEDEVHHHLHCALADHLGLSLPCLCSAIQRATYPLLSLDIPGKVLVPRTSFCSTKLSCHFTAVSLAFSLIPTFLCYIWWLF